MASASRAHQILSNPARFSAANNNNARNHRSNLNPKRPSSRRTAAVTCECSGCYSEIPIALHRSPRPISRGFLPWRLSDDGPGAKPLRQHGAVIRNPSHFRTHVPQ
jgi:hypothetical protein